MTATGLFTDASTTDLTAQVQWQSNGAAASVDGMGLVTAVEAGTSTITAIDVASGVSSNTTGMSAAVSVTALRLLSIAVTPSRVRLPVGAEVLLRADGSFNNLNVVDLSSSVQWTTQSATVATIGTVGNDLGVARAISGGETIVAARDVARGVSSDDSQRFGDPDG